LSNGAQFALRDMVVADPTLIGQTITLNVPVSDPFDQLNKGLIDRETPEQFRRVKNNEVAWFDTLKDKGVISKPFNAALFTAADSRFPELAGLKGALVGSFWALLICCAIAFPLGIGAAIYLEEFAPKNRFSDFIEVNINNLAAVPSVVFGLLALTVFIGWFGLPRSTPFVGGLTLALMTMPTIIIATRAALKAVPPSIREAALGLGASRQQVVFQHVLPLAMPGVLTGTIIGLAQALGETAPLLLIGMNAFITSAASSPFESATALPTQIFIWADSPERGFVSRTSAAILVLLGFLVVMNAVAIYLRQKFERKW
jgi:phosphate transport system permease protein